MIRSRHEQDKLNAEIDQRLLEFQTPKEVTMSVNTSMINVYSRANFLDLETHRITKKERDYILVKRKEASK